MKWCHGSTRSVLLIGKYAIKFPTVKHWRNFLQGILCNDTEYSFSHLDTPLLAPVLWCSWGSIVIVMPRAEVKSYDAEDRFAFVDEFWKLVEEVEGLNKDTIKNIVENKVCSIGMINGKPVAIDYGIL